MLVIAPRNMHLDIINYYRKDNPFFDVKVVDKAELVGAIGYQARKDTVLYLMGKGYSYDEAVTYLNFIKTDFVPNNPKLEKLSKLQKELVASGHLYRSEVAKLLFEHKSALVVGYQDYDEELKHLSNLLDMKLEFFDFGSEFKVNEINKFTRLEDEVYFVLNEIAHDIDSNRDINDIYILNRSEEYIYYLKTFSPSFGFNINYPNTYSFNKTGVYSEFKKLYEESKDLEEALAKLEEVCKDDDIYHQFVDALHKINVKELPYEIASVYLDKELANRYVEEPHYLNAVKVISEPTLLNNKKVYVLGFVQGQFPKSQKDDSYLNEQELLYLNKLTNKAKTKIDQDNILNFFKTSNEFVLSYSLKSLENSKMFASPIVNILPIKEVSNPFKDYFYSIDVLRYIACSLKDLNILYKEKSDKYLATKDLVEPIFNKFDNSYKGAKVNNKDSYLKLSTSQLTDYASCPFRYYLGRVLEVDPFEETIDSIFGNIVHKLLEKSLLNDSFDISSYYDELVEESNVSEEIKVLWSLSLKDQIMEMVKYVKFHNRYMNNPSFELEKKIDINLNELTALTGRIDKMVILDNKSLVMIDYKTGSSGDFDDTFLSEGLSSQLPTYALLAKQSNYSKYSISGLYINHIYTSKEVELKEDELIPKYLRLSGKTLDNYSSFFNFDSTIASGKSSFVNSVSSKEEVLTSKGNAIISKDKLDEYIKIVKDKYLEVSELIRANKFDISPCDKGKQNTRACLTCSYRDICYVRENQVRYLSTPVEEDNE